MMITEKKNVQEMGVIICRECDKELESFESERVVTNYGICSCCERKGKE